MITVTKTVRFDAAHILTNHQGLCRNLHGHTYRIDVSVCRRGESAEADDMVIDFKDLKRVIEELVVSRFDHAFMYNETSAAESEIAAVLARHGMRAVALPFRSTAENLARYFYETLARRIDAVSSVKVWETPDSCAEYRADGRVGEE